MCVALIFCRQRDEFIFGDAHKTMRTPINTEVGIISGRDAIFLDEQKLVQGDSCGMIFVGELNGDLCSNNATGKEWIPYKLSFEYPIYYFCCELDLYDHLYRAKLPKKSSSFDIVTKSDLLTNLTENTIDFSSRYEGNFSHFVLATYDYIYEIVARDFTLEIDTSN